MSNAQKFYINGAWVAASTDATIDVINPANGGVVATIAAGSKTDVDHAVKAASDAFPDFSSSTKSDRIGLLKRILDVYQARQSSIGDLISDEMGAPLAFARNVQAGTGVSHLKKMIEVLSAYDFETLNGTTMVRREAIGVVGLITPWNWPINQIICKVAPALAAGCTMVLKPSELSPLSAIAFAEVLDEAGVAPGVFNLVNGTGETVGDAMSRHPDIQMISLTGSTRAGIEVTRASAQTVKRITLELGGKAANVILDDADLNDAVTKGTLACMRNAGQSCSAPTRMLVPRDLLKTCTEIAKNAAEGLRVGDPKDDGVDTGPVISERQFDKIQDLIESGLVEGADLVTGGKNKPDGLEMGNFVKPTVFSNVSPSMRIAREEIFGPVLSIIPYDDEEDAIRIANDTEYGLTAYVQSKNIDAARRIARRLRAGSVLINYAPVDLNGPFGGFKQSGNGREYGVFGLEEFLEVKGMVGYGAPENT